MLKPWVILTNKFEFNEFKTSIMTDVWIVQYKQLDTGNRIEGFNVKFSVFTDRNNALQYAFTMARDFGNPDWNITIKDVMYIKEIVSMIVGQNLLFL